MAFSRAIAPLAKAQLTPTKRKNEPTNQRKRNCVIIKYTHPKGYDFYPLFFF
jgi:hypothetical protein